MEDREHFFSALREGTDALHVPLTEDAMGLMWCHYAAMVERNRVMNLTRITEPRAAAVKHFVDSVAPLAWIKAGERRGLSFDVHTALDIGTGAGFPAVPLAIARPEWRVTAIDGTAKKIRFVEETAKSLKVDNLGASHAHATQWRTRRRFDLVLARAIGPLADFLRCAARFAGAAGYLVAYKSAEIDEVERSNAADAAREVNVHLAETFQYDLRVGDETVRRSLLVYRARNE